MQIINTDWIITTDADCVVNKNWLLTLENYIQLHDVAMIAGAVTYTCGNSFYTFPAIGYSKFTRRNHWEFWY
jgi:GT2 family glycosyltransferase